MSVRLGPSVALAAVLALMTACSGTNHLTSPATGSSASASALAGLASAATGTAVDGILCEAHEGVLFHIHAHLAVFVDGRARTIPEGIGIAPPREVEPSSEGPFVLGGRCFYWLHSHTADGIIHIESPVQRTFTLGDYFAIWGQPLGTNQAGPATGPVTSYVNGTRFIGDPSTIPLAAHEVIQLDVGTDVAPQPFAFPPGL